MYYHRNVGNVVMHNLIRIPDCHRLYDALQYPLIFWKGQSGYEYNIPQINPDTADVLHGKKVSCMNFYAYILMVRDGQSNHILRFRGLMHQFIVDMYAKIETERLNYISYNQNTLRADQYIHLQDAMANDVYVDPNSLGQKIILPSTFVNSPRYLQQYVQDTFAYVRNYGKPDLFITFTCNPKWKEITDELFCGQSSTDRQDIKASVFRLKVEKLMNVLNKGFVLGTTVAFVYSIEWQKRGLPHVHILIWLLQKLRPHQIDQLISAEIPDPEVDPDLFQLVTGKPYHLHEFRNNI